MFWVLILLASFLLIIFIDRHLRNEKFEQIPGPPGIFFLENALSFIMDPVKLFYYLRKLANCYKQVFKVKIGPKKFIVIMNPEDVEVLISGSRYNSKGFLYGFIEAWLNEGLLLSDGSKWHHRRKILTPAFHFNILRHFRSIIEENCLKFVEKLEYQMNINNTIDIIPFVTEFTLHSICETAMGTKLDGDINGVGKSYKEAIYKLGRYVVYRAQRVWMYPNLIYPFTIVGRKQKKILQLIGSFRDNVIDKRRESEDFGEMFNDVTIVNDDMYLKSGRKKLAMLDLLLQAERNGSIDAKGVGEEVDTFMFEGHDTTATALQMILMLLANNENCQDKILKEYYDVCSASSLITTLSELSEMKYLECCIKEGLRLYPPVHFITRKIDEPLKLNKSEIRFPEEYEVPAGTDCTIFIYDLHRRSDQFKEPLEYRPERFLNDAPTWHPYAYIPFSAGPRNCIGQKFAMMEMKLAVLAVLRRFRLHAVTRPQDVIFVTDFILRPNHPIYVRFEKRL